PPRRPRWQDERCAVAGSGEHYLFITSLVILASSDDFGQRGPRTEATSNEAAGAPQTRPAQLAGKLQTARRNQFPANPTGPRRPPAQLRESRARRTLARLRGKQTDPKTRAPDLR